VRILRPFILLLSFGLLTLPALNNAAIADDAAPVKLKLQAAIVTGAKALKDDIKWSIAPLSKDGTAAQEVTKASPDVQLVPGKYRVTAVLGFATVTRDITVTEAGKEELVFDAGWARFQMVASQKAKPIEDNVHWTIYRFTKGGVDEKAKLTEIDAPSPQLALPKGWYTVRAKYQGIVSEMVSEVKAGTLYKYTVVAYAGKATFTAVDAKGKTVKNGAVWTIERVAKNNGGKRVPVTTDSTASPSLLLGEGKYVVVVKVGDLIGEAPFDIQATRNQTVTVKLKPQG
jgi:hypothetical protein